MVKKYLFIFALCALSGLTQTTSAQPSDEQGHKQIFFSALHDIPLMDGMTEIQDETMMFDKPGGRIIDAYAISDRLSSQDITLYYNATLPQFGWGKTDNLHFYRDKEILSLSFPKHDDATLLKISIRPSL